MSKQSNENHLPYTEYYSFFEFVLYRICGERELPGEGFSILTRTADTEHKAWRKRQICYRLAKRGSVTHAVTDVILCSKIKVAPEGFTLAGELNGVTVCFKSGPIAHRPPPSIPIDQSGLSELENNLYYMNIRNGTIGTNINENGKTANANNNDYEFIRTSYRIDPAPIGPHGRPAPKPPAAYPPAAHPPGNVLFNSTFSFQSNINNAIFLASSPYRNVGTLGIHTEVDGVPFVLNPALSPNPFADFDVSTTITMRIINYSFPFFIFGFLLISFPL